MYINTYTFSLSLPLSLSPSLSLPLPPSLSLPPSSRSLKQTYELGMLEEGEFDERVFLNSSKTEHEEEELLGRSHDQNERYTSCTGYMYMYILDTLE